MVDQNYMSGGSRVPDYTAKDLSGDDAAYLEYLRNGNLRGGGGDIFTVLGGGQDRAGPDTVNPFTDPSQAYGMYRGYQPNSYNYANAQGDSPYTLGTTANTLQGQAWARNGSQYGYENALKAQTALAQQGDLGRQYEQLGNYERNRMFEAATQQQELAKQTAAVRTGRVQDAQTVQGQQDYQGYLRQIQSGTQAADKTQAQADLLAKQYAAPDTTAAMMQLRQATDANLQSNLALARSGRSPAGMANAIVANANAGQSAAAQSAQLQAQQEQSLRTAWMQSQNAAGSQYQALGQQQGEMTRAGAQMYQGAQQVNANEAASQRAGLTSAASQWNQASEGWNRQTANRATALAGQGAALNNQYSGYAQQSSADMSRAAAEMTLRQQQEARDYNEWVRQESVRQKFSDQRYGTMTNANTTNAAAQNQFAAGQAAAKAKGIGLAIDTGARIGAAAMTYGTSEAARAGANAAKSKPYDPDTDYSGTENG